MCGWWYFRGWAWLDVHCMHDGAGAPQPWCPFQVHGAPVAYGGPHAHWARCISEGNKEGRKGHCFCPSLGQGLGEPLMAAAWSVLHGHSPNSRHHHHNCGLPVAGQGSGNARRGGPHGPMLAADGCSIVRADGSHAGEPSQARWFACLDGGPSRRAQLCGRGTASMMGNGVSQASWTGVGCRTALAECIG